MLNHKATILRNGIERDRSEKPPGIVVGDANGPKASQQLDKDRLQAAGTLGLGHKLHLAVPSVSLDRRTAAGGQIPPVEPDAPYRHWRLV